MSDLVGNPEDRFSRVAAHLRLCSPIVYTAQGTNNIDDGLKRDSPDIVLNPGPLCILYFEKGIIEFSSGKFG